MYVPPYQHASAGLMDCAYRIVQEYIGRMLDAWPGGSSKELILEAIPAHSQMANPLTGIMIYFLIQL